MVEHFPDPRHLPPAGRHREILRSAQNSRQREASDIVGRPVDLVETRGRENNPVLLGPDVPAAPDARPRELLHHPYSSLWSAVFVDRVDPAHLLRPLDRLDVEIDNDRLIVAAHQYAFECLVGRRVDLLVWHIGRHKDEITGSGFGDEFQSLAPAHSGAALQYINDALEMAVVMGPGLGVGVDLDRAGPDLLRPDPREIDRRGAVHARRLRRVGVELVARDHLDAVRLPIDWLVRLLLAHGSAPSGFGLDLIWFIPIRKGVDDEACRSGPDLELILPRRRRGRARLLQRGRARRRARADLSGGRRLPGDARRGGRFRGWLGALGTRRL